MKAINTIDVIEKVQKTYRYTVTVFDRDGFRIFNDSYVDRINRMVLENTTVKTYWKTDNGYIVILNEALSF